MVSARFCGAALAALLALSVCAPAAQAAPLRMDYIVTDLGGGTYDYEFKLTLDNNDGTWSAGQEWTWIVWGDAQNAVSPLADFVGDTTDLPVGPFDRYTTTSGGHNGPSMLHGPGGVLAWWMPAAVGDCLMWSGTSSTLLPQGDMLWSIIWGQNGGTRIDFEVATRVTSFGEPIPEPGTLALVAGAAACLLWRRRTR